MAEEAEDPVCAYPAITEVCKKECTAPFALYESCIKRIEKKGEGDCEAWYFDYYKCIDKCRVPKIFKTLK